MIYVMRSDCYRSWHPKESSIFILFEYYIYHISTKRNNIKYLVPFITNPYIFCFEFECLSLCVWVGSEKKSFYSKGVMYSFWVYGFERVKVRGVYKYRA